jgi:glucokinase
MSKILAGDIGGTHTRLALYEEGTGTNPVMLSEKDSPSNSWTNLEDAVTAFLSQENVSVESACFAVAGPVRNGTSRLTNLSWTVDTARLQRALGLKYVHVCNDLEAVALGVNSLSPDDLVQLNAGAPGASGNKAVIAAGTGLGQATIFSGPKKRQYVIASEGGHAGLAATTKRQAELLAYFIENKIEPGWESVLSGAGIVRIHEFLRLQAGQVPTPSWLSAAILAHEDAAGAITARALDHCDQYCEQTLERFIEYYGNQAGNLALTVMATGGVFIAGGIAPRIVKRLLEDDTFWQAFARGRQKDLLAAMPVHVIVHQNPGLLGAATYAAHNR